jgi:hypothetical protein
MQCIFQQVGFEIVKLIITMVEDTSTFCNLLFIIPKGLLVPGCACAARGSSVSSEIVFPILEYKEYSAVLALPSRN